MFGKSWVPVRALTGETDTIAVRDAILNADRYAGLAAPLPICNVAVLRLLLAVVHRIYGPADIDEWITLYEDGFDVERYDAYTFPADWPRNYNLDDHRHGVMSLERLTIAHQDSDGTTWRPDGDRISTMAHPLVWYVTAQTWGLGGRLAGPAYVQQGVLCNKAAHILTGDTLRETIILNLTVHPDPLYDPDGDMPTWEGVADVPGRLANYSFSGQPLMIVEDGLAVLEGLDRQDTADFDPMLRYSKNDKAIPGNRRALWRDLDALLPHTDMAGRPPAVMNYLPELILEGALSGDALYGLSVIGTTGFQAKNDGFVNSSIRLPGAVTGDQNLTDVAVIAVGLAKQKARSLSDGLNAIGALSALSNNRKLDLIDEYYWSQLRSEYMQFLMALSVGPEGSPEEAVETFQKIVRRRMYSAYDSITGAFNISLREGAMGWHEMTNGK